MLWALGPVIFECLDTGALINAVMRCLVGFVWQYALGVLQMRYLALRTRTLGI
jgi:hypothetical protein